MLYHAGILCDGFTEFVHIDFQRSRIDRYPNQFNFEIRARLEKLSIESIFPPNGNYFIETRMSRVGHDTRK